MFLISPAYAETATVASDAAPSMLTSMAPLLLVFLVFYVLVIRPQNKRVVEHRKSIEALQKGDKVVTGGGIIATVKKMEEGSDEIVLEIASGVEVRVLRHSLMMVRK
jgi:preprotein translocase subunit YajC